MALVSGRCIRFRPGSKWAAPLLPEGEISNAAQLVSAVAVRRGGVVSMLLANHTPGRLQIVLAGKQAPISSRSLDETSVEKAMRSPAQYRQESICKPAAAELTLLPFGYMRINL